MSSTPRRLFALFLIAALALAILPFNPGAAKPSPDLKQLALNQVSQEKSIPADQLEVVNQSKSAFGSTEGEVHFFKMIDAQTGEIHPVALDSEGNAVDEYALVEQTKSAYEAQYGRIDKSLVDYMAGAPAGEPVPVVVWLFEPNFTPPAEPEFTSESSKEEMEAFESAISEERAAEVTQLAAPVADRLASLGFQSSVSPSSAFVYASLPPERIKEVAAWPEVRIVNLDSTYEPELENAWNTIGMQWMVKRHIIGRGSEVAVVEVGGRGASSNPYLRYYTQNTTNVCASASSHSTGVLGIVFSSHPTRTGFAMGAKTWLGGSCSGSNSELHTAMNNAHSWGAEIFNTSFGAAGSLTPNSDDAFYDDYTTVRIDNVVKSAGNRGSTDGYVTHPGLGYNTITVGNFDDRNTGFDRSDDIMRASSSYVDPTSTHGDREKPEISAPGTNINSTTTSSPWTGGIGSGTSYAAPVISSILAMLMQRDTALISHPLEAKAVMMASAFINIEGSVRLSDKDGVGGAWPIHADRLANNENGNSGRYSYNCSASANTDVATIPLTAGKRTKIVIAWRQYTSYASYASQPGADLDLKILNPSNSTVTGSYSWDNTYEVVDFTPSTTGSYKIRVSKVRCSQSPSYVSWAWKQK